MKSSVLPLTAPDKLKPALNLKHSGITLLEVVLAVGLFTLIGSGLFLAAWGAISATEVSQNYQAALALAEEGLEAARSLRDQNWNNLTAGPHGLTNSNGFWEWIPTFDVSGIFTRQITVTDLAVDRKEITSRVSFSPNRSVELITRLTNFGATPFLSWGQTTQADFSTGSLNDVVIVSQGDGAIRLLSGENDGTFTSAPFDTGSGDTAYGPLNFVRSGDPLSTLRFQTKTSNSEPGLGSAVWLGPDGTRNSYYAASGTQIVTQGGIRWIQFRAYFDSPGEGQSAVLEAIQINYVP